MSKEEKLFVYASILCRVDAEKEEERKAKVKKPSKGGR